MSFRVSNEFFIRALLCFVRVGYTRTMGIQRKPLTADHQTGGGGAQLTTTIRCHCGQTAIILIKQQIITIRPWTGLVWEGNENIYFFL